MQRAIAGALGGSLRVMTVNIYYDGDCPATVGERVQVLKETYGEYHDPGYF